MRAAEGEAPMNTDTEPKEPSDRWDRLSEFLRREAFPGSTDLRITETVRPTGGASWETFLVSVDLRMEGRRQTRRVAVKRAPETGPLAPYLVTKDVAIFSSLVASDVPVPELLAWTEDPSVFVRPFSVTSFIEGESHDITKVERWPVWQSQREALGLEMIDKLAALQRFRWQGTSLEEALGPRGSADQRVAGLVDRYLEPLLEAAGLQLVSLAGDYDGTQISDDSEMIVARCACKLAGEVALFEENVDKTGPCKFHFFRDIAEVERFENFFREGAWVSLHFLRRCHAPICLVVSKLRFRGRGNKSGSVDGCSDGYHGLRNTAGQ